MGLENFVFGGYEMIAIIIFGILAVAVIVFGIFFNEGFLDICALLFALVMLFVFTVMSSLDVDGYQVMAKKYDGIMLKISWMENHQNQATMDESLELYQEIKDMNEMIQRGKANCRNVWNGALISDKYLEMNEIEIPTWLAPSQNTSLY